MTENGYALFAISYDPVEVLAGFAEKYDISYPLLSDEGSMVIKQLGLLNEQVFEQHAANKVPRNEEHWGVPYPGVFLLDANGVITQKRFRQSYRERETGVGLLENALGIASPFHGAEAEADTADVQVRAYLDSPTYSFSQLLRLTLELTIAPGLHVYGQPIPEGYTPLTVAIEPIERLSVGELELPAPARYTMEGLDEEFRVYTGTVRGSLPLVFGARPGSGDQIVHATVRYQACGDTVCYPPASVTLELPVQEVAMVESSLPLKQS